jgi:hypothetical protein
MDQAAAVLFGSVVIVTLAMIDATVGAASGVTGAKPQSQILRRGEPDCLAGHRGFEPPNPAAGYLIGFAWQLGLR